MNAMGMRAEESAARARKLPLKRSDRNSRAGRSWYDWLPVFDLTEAQVFDVIRAAGQSPHPAYGMGMSRLSCVFCIMASRADRGAVAGFDRRAGRTRPRRRPLLAFRLSPWPDRKTALPAETRQSAAPQNHPQYAGLRVARGDALPGPPPFRRVPAPPPRHSGVLSMTQPATISADYTLRPSDLAATLALLVEARQPAMVWGAPGTAKSMIAQQVAADGGREYVDVRALLLDPVDLRGTRWARRCFCRRPVTPASGSSTSKSCLPACRWYKRRWAPPVFLPPTGDTGLWLINLEELPSCVPMVQAALYQLALERKVGEYPGPSSTTPSCPRARRSSPAATARATAAWSTACRRRSPRASSTSKSASMPRTGWPGARPTETRPGSAVLRAA